MTDWVSATLARPLPRVCAYFAQTLNEFIAGVAKQLASCVI